MCSMPTCVIYAQLVAHVIIIILIKVIFIILIMMTTILRRLVASRDVKPGEVVVVESSLILVPSMQVLFNSIGTILIFFNFFINSLILVPGMQV